MPLAFACIILAHVGAFGQSASAHCSEEREIVAALSSNDSAALAARSQNLEVSYPIRLYAAYRALQLRPRSRVAARLFLSLLPDTSAQEAAVYNASGHNCETTVPEDLKLDAGYDGLERLAARAISLDPDETDRYVRFGLVTTEDVHSQYASRSVSVCQSFPQLFKAAVHRLPEKDRAWFAQHIVDPRNCRVMMPEEE